MTDQKKILCVFDFDRSFADADSDSWVLKSLAPELWADLRTRYPAEPWNRLIDECLSKLPSLGKSLDDVRDAVSKLPAHRHMAEVKPGRPRNAAAAAR